MPHRRSSVNGLRVPLVSSMARSFVVPEVLNFGCGFLLPFETRYWRAIN